MERAMAPRIATGIKMERMSSKIMRMKSIGQY